MFGFLQRGIAKQLARLYPVRPFNADRWLNDEIFRASCDPCALQVRASAATHTQPLSHTVSPQSLPLRSCRAASISPRPPRCRTSSARCTAAQCSCCRACWCAVSVNCLCRAFARPTPHPLFEASTHCSNPSNPRLALTFPSLLLQDPLNDARGRAIALEERIEQATAVLIDAGHCPHDECPDLVNDAIADFVFSLSRTSATPIEPAAVA